MTRTLGRSAGVGSRKLLAGTVTTATVRHVEEFNAVASLSDSRHHVLIDNRPHIAGAQAFGGKIDSKNRGLEEIQMHS